MSYNAVFHLLHVPNYTFTENKIIKKQQQQAVLKGILIIFHLNSHIVVQDVIHSVKS